MHARLLYWFQLSTGVTAIYLLILLEYWGKSPLPITELLLFQRTGTSEAVWWHIDSGISRFWNLLTVPFIASTLVLHDETDDFYETFGFVFFGLIAYGFLYLDSTDAYSIFFLIILGLTIGFMLSARNALRIGYTILIFCGCYTWLFPVYSIGLLMYGIFVALFSTLIVSCLFIRVLLKKLQALDTTTT